ncbi:MAG: hypothetical protein LBQ49_03190 [Rickettsiales bacterium]|jgi:hypothetical protein|nr:hypothetical protein [Rickettsiales bacterium]
MKKKKTTGPKKKTGPADKNGAKKKPPRSVVRFLLTASAALIAAAISIPYLIAPNASGFSDGTGAGVVSCR